MTRRMALGLVALLAAGIAFLAMRPVDAQQDPPGNNGTVKVDGIDFDDHPDNEPHVGCSFQIDFYGFDEGNINAQVTFTAIPPTAGGVVGGGSVFIGQDPAGGGTDLDASQVFVLDLSGIDPQPQQGHHVRLDISGPVTKSKVFWVEDCGPPTTTTTTTTTTQPTTTTTTEPPTTTTTTEPPTTTTTTEPATTTTTTEPPATTTTEPPATTTTEPPATTSTTAPPGPTTTERGQVVVPPPTTTPPSTSPPTTVLTFEDAVDLPRTGSNVGSLAFAGAGLLALGALVTVYARRRHAAGTAN